MTVRRPDLEEWFMEVQLRAIVREHVHCLGAVEVDVTPLAEAWARAEQSRIAQAGTGSPRTVPWTAAGVQAVAMICRRMPNLNRALFWTPLGSRVVDFPYVAVNLPVRLSASGHLSACLLREPDARGLAVIADEIREFRARPLASMPVGRLFIGNRNTWWNRIRLRVLHWVSRRLPWAYLRAGGGGVSVSSMLHRKPVGASFGAVALGPTGLTFTLCGLHRRGDRTTMAVGVAFDHSILTGEEAWAGAEALEGCFAELAGRLG